MRVRPRHLVAAFAAWVLAVAALVELGERALGRPIERAVADCAGSAGSCKWRVAGCSEATDPTQREDCAWAEGFRTFCGTLGLAGLFLAPIAGFFCARLAQRSSRFSTPAWPWWVTCAACLLAALRLTALGLPAALFG